MFTKLSIRNALLISLLAASIFCPAAASRPAATGTQAPTSIAWRFTLDYPGVGWQQPGFDAGRWGPGGPGFGDGDVDVRTPWTAGRLWLRGIVTLDARPVAPQILLRHRGEVQVYVNGHLVADVTGRVDHLVPVPIEGEALASLKPGANIVAVHAVATGLQPFVEVRLDTTAPGGAVAAPLYRDPRFDGAADPTVVWDAERKRWTMFYTQRRANLKDLPGVGFCYGSDVGMAVSTDGGRHWAYDGEALGLEYKGGRNTLWAPEVVRIGNQYHMWVSYIEGVHTRWEGISTLTHFTSPDLRHWTFSDSLPMRDVIDGAIFPLPSGGWRLFYKQDNKTMMADTPDLRTWKEVGVAAGDVEQEGPNVFEWRGRYWMIADVWRGQRVYTSEDLTTWKAQGDQTILGSPGQRRDDATFGRHADVVVQGDRAFIVYFTHPGGDTNHEEATSLKRTSVQVAELEIEAGRLVCRRDKPLDYRWEGK